MNKMKTLVLGSVLAASTVASSVAMAGASANVALSTDYVFRGYSFSEGAPAISGGFDYDFENGFAVGAWGSSTSGVNSGLELDLYGSYSGEVSGVGYSVGYTNYRFPGGDTASDVDVGEVFAGVSFMGFGLTYYDGDNDFGADYLELTYGMDLTKDYSLGLSYGITDFDGAAEDVADYKVSVSTEIGGFGFELAATDTDANTPGDLNDDSRVFLTISKSM